MNQSAAYLSFYTDHTGTLIFWLDERSPEPRVFRSALKAAELDAAGQKLTRVFSKANINPRRPEQVDITWLAAIGENLLEPLREELQSRQALVAAPHHGLHALPLHLLPLDGIPLGISHAVSYVPNLAIYDRLLKRAAPEENVFKHPSASLATAAAEDSLQVREYFASAPKAYAQKTGGLFLENTQATSAALLRCAQDSHSLYLSCHGQFDQETPLDSALFLSDGTSLPSRTGTADSDHRLSVKAILGSRIRSRLVILDACLSGVQALSSGDEPAGFPTAFLLAGSSAVIASNWSVEQTCAKTFMLALTGHWSSGNVTLGAAMQHAYQLTRAQYPHPFSWGGFSLFGNDRLLVSST